ncbi:DUF4430 domain-containing protein [Oscillibacter sp.]|uniref:DUF4430 domain-containing protein n=1 Tax=Oscillibacter sp. TaxID=1945593 RepID=UPI0026384BFC|nr:DUF4430 domain-containing protein [Oscillibacter sp.]MDD3347207.1 DUF4430 domain-containing protein [Oscillibacter sp.]
MWWKHNKRKILVTALIAAVLAAAFYIGGDTPGARGWTAGSGSAAGSAPQELAGAAQAAAEKVEAEKADAKEADAAEAAAKPIEKEAAAPAASDPPTPEGDQTENPPAESAREQVEPTPETPPAPVKPQEAAQSAYSCTISISCAEALNHLDFADAEKAEVIPSDGWILNPLSVSFEEGENAFDVLSRTCQAQGIHMEYMNTPLYNSAYIEGIANLYEFDVGEQSGWMYRVNDWFPNYGCSRYQLKDGDRIDWVYTCELGADVGGGLAGGSQRD